MTTMAATTLWWLLALSYPLWVALGLVGWLGEPHIGVETAPAPDGQMVITRMHPGGAAWRSGAQLGDVLLEIDGVRANERSWNVSGDAGAEFLILKTDGTLISDSVKSYERSTGPTVVSLVLVSLAFAGTGSVIFLRSARSPEILTVSILFLVAATAFAVAPASAQAHPWAIYVAVISNVWSAALFFVYFSLLGDEREGGRSFAGFLRWGMLAWAASLTVLFSLSIAALPGLYEPVRWLAFAELGLGLLGGVSYLVLSYVGSDSPVMRERLKTMVFGISAAVAPFVILSVAPTLVGLSPLSGRNSRSWQRSSSPCPSHTP